MSNRPSFETTALTASMGAIRRSSEDVKPEVQRYLSSKMNLVLAYWNSSGAPRPKRPSSLPKSPLLETAATGGAMSCQNKISAAIDTTGETSRNADFMGSASSFYYTGK